MQFEGYRRTANVPNLTPLIDIVFLLLIFFMLTSHFVREDVQYIELPESATGEINQPDEKIEVLIRKNGEYVFEGQTVDITVFESELRNKLASSKHKIVSIKGDRAANLGNIVELIDLLRKAGASGVDIVTEHHE